MAFELCCSCRLRANTETETETESHERIAARTSNVVCWAHVIRLRLCVSAYVWVHSLYGRRHFNRSSLSELLKHTLSRLLNRSLTS